MEENKPILERASFEFTQEANCISRDEFESLKIDFESSLGLDRDGGGFFVLKTKGWSIDSVEALQELFDRIEKIVIKN